MSGPGRILRTQLRRLSTQPPFRTQSGTTSTPFFGSSHPESGPSQASRWRRRLIYTGFFGTLGVGAGKWMDKKISAPPAPGTDENRREVEEIRQFYDLALPIVHDLRSHPDYVESGVYENYTEEQNAHRLTTGPLRGSGGFALQRVFWNQKDNNTVTVIYLGRGIEGWPTVVHGGALATVIDENLGRVAIRHFPQKTGVTANLDINYRRPVYSDQFYSLHTTLDRERSTDRKAYVKTELRDITGVLCTEASGLFVVPKKLKLAKLGENF